MSIKLLNIFVETTIANFFRIHCWIESAQHLFEIEIFSNTINAFNVTFKQFNTIKSINFLFLFLSLLTTNLWKAVFIH